MRHSRVPSPAEENLELASELEQRARAERSRTQRVSDTLVRVFGSIWFVLAHFVTFSAWFTVNSGAVPGVRPFDPFPFGILTLFVSAEGVILALFILISQNRMMQDADRRARLDLQVNLLAERRSAKILEALQHVSARLGVEGLGDDPEAAELVEKTNVSRLAEEVEKRAPRG